jgi:2-polyprenyl-3-methyl-5-hydroxy-6-metoxy-1,4-benzoquinol methylase
MPSELTKQEKDKYEAMWNVPSYRHTSPGYLQIESFLGFFKDLIEPCDSIIDFGCGSGFTALPLIENGFNVHLIDIASNALADKIAALTLLAPDRVRFTQGCLWDLPDDVLSEDFCYCMDVLEHIPPEKVDDVLWHISKRSKKGGALQVYLLDEPFGNLIGKTLHLTIKPLSYWIEKIGTYFDIKEIKSIIPDVRYTFFVETKKLNLRENSNL